MPSNLSSDVLIGDISLLTARFFAEEAKSGPAPQASMSATISVSDVSFVEEMICVATDLRLQVTLAQEGAERPCFESEVRVGCTAATNAHGARSSGGANWALERVLAHHAAEASIGFARSYVCDQCLKSSLHQPLQVPPIDVDALLSDSGAFSS